MTIQEEISNLEEQLQTVAEPENQVELILRILQHYVSLNSKAGHAHIENLKQLASELKQGEYQAWVHYYEGNHHRLSSNYAQALTEMQKALALFALHNNQNGLRRSYHNNGLIYAEHGDFSKALTNYFAALKISEVLNDKTGTAGLYNNIGNIYWAQGNYPDALFYHMMALKIREEIGDIKGIASSYINIGNVYSEQGNYPEALSNYLAVLKIKEESGNKRDIYKTYANIGSVYFSMGNYDEALSNHLLARTIAKETGDKIGIADSYSNTGAMYLKLGDYDKALANLLLSLEMSSESGYKDGVVTSGLHISQCYIARKEYNKAATCLDRVLEDARESGMKAREKEALKTWYELKKAEGDGMAALTYYEKFVALEQELTGAETTQKIAGMRLSREMEVKEKEMEIERLRNVELKQEKEKSDRLLRNILPEEVIDEINQHGNSEPKLYEDVTVMYADFRNFTAYSERFSPKEVVGELNNCYKAFDEVMDKYNIEKIKTMGDGYIAVSGLPVINTRHAEDMVQAAIEIRDFMLRRKNALGDKTLEVRIGLHSGKVVAGIVGVKKYAYDIWGDAVNTAARMQQSDETGKVNISEATYQLVKDKFKCTYRGKIAAKNKGEIDMYFVE